MFANVQHTGTLLAYDQISDVWTQHFMSSETSQKFLVDSYYLVQSLLPYLITRALTWLGSSCVSFSQAASHTHWSNHTCNLMLLLWDWPNIVLANLTAQVKMLQNIGLLIVALISLSKCCKLLGSFMLS